MNTKRNICLSLIIMTHVTATHGMASLATRVAATVGRSSARNMSSLNNFAKLADSYAPTIPATPQKMYPLIVRPQNAALIVKKSEATALIVQPRKKLFTSACLQQGLLTLKNWYTQSREKIITETIPSFLSAGIVLSGFGIQKTLTSVMRKAEKDGKMFHTV